jgi:hypothetical protein
MYGPWEIEVDVDRTKEFYDKYHLITEDCECIYCANYVLACDNFPQDIKGLFGSLGIDPRKEGEISQYTENNDGTHLYGAFYHIVGRIIRGPELWVPTQKGSEVSSPNFAELKNIGAGFTQDLSLVPEEFPLPAIQFEIEIDVPWLLK